MYKKNELKSKLKLVYNEKAIMKKIFYFKENKYSIDNCINIINCMK
jgi:hypothetical protein